MKGTPCGTSRAAPDKLYIRSHDLVLKSQGTGAVSLAGVVARLSPLLSRFAIPLLPSPIRYPASHLFRRRKRDSSDMQPNLFKYGRAFLRPLPRCRSSPRRESLGTRRFSPAAPRTLPQPSAEPPFVLDEHCECRKRNKRHNETGKIAEVHRVVRQLLLNGEKRRQTGTGRTSKGEIRSILGTPQGYGHQ